MTERLELSVREQMEPVIERLNILATEAGTAPAIPAEHYGCLRDIVESLAEQVDGYERVANSAHRVMVAQTKLYRELLLCLGAVCLFLIATVVWG